MPMETDAGAAAEAGPKEAEEMEVVKKRRTRKTSIPLQAATGGYDLKAVQVLTFLAAHDMHSAVLPGC